MKRKCLLIFLIGLSILTIFTVYVNITMINSTKKQIVDIENINKYNDVDAIIILGCKVHSYGPSLMLTKRLEKGKDVYNLIHSKIILTGDHGTKEYDEVNTMLDFMLKNNIPREDIFLDHAGFSTYDSIYRAKYVFEAKKVIIVTQKYHMYRALFLANKLDLEAVGVVASDIPQKGIMLKNEIREILSRDKNYLKGIIKPQSKYVGEKISLKQDGYVTNG